MNTSLDEAVNLISEQTSRLIAENPLIFQLIPAFGAAVVFYFLIRSIYGKSRLALENSVFILFCIMVLFMMLATFATARYEFLQYDRYLASVMFLVFTTLPSVFCLHIWTQVSHLKIKVTTILLYFIVPFFVSGMFIYGLFTGSDNTDVWHLFNVVPLSYVTLLYVLYWICIIIKSFRLCLNVFYQMPRHMQDSTTLLMSALAVNVVCSILIAIINSGIGFLFYLVMQLFCMYQAYKGFFRASASNVITTSRQFIYNNFGMQIIILSRKGRILEWNNPKDNYLIKAVPPRYLQLYTDYLAQVIEAGKGVISPHDENILTLHLGGNEHVIQIQKHSVTQDKKKYGELIEIAEVTNIYEVLHQMEEISLTDQMTGLRNRNAYIRKAQEVMQAEHMPLLIIIGDVNNLKKINDTLGHVIGDKMLSDIAVVIREYAPENAFLARIGGDEFVALIMNANEDVAEAFSKNIEERLSQINDDEYGVPSISMGWAVVHSPTEDYNTVFEEADSWMYKRKKAYYQRSNAPRVLTGLLPGVESSNQVETSRQACMYKCEAREFSDLCRAKQNNGQCEALKHVEQSEIKQGAVKTEAPQSTEPLGISQGAGQLEKLVTEQVGQSAAEHIEPVLAEQAVQPATENIEQVLAEQFNHPLKEHIEPVAVEQVVAEQFERPAAENVKPVAEHIVTEQFEQPATENIEPVLAEQVDQPATEHIEPVAVEQVVAEQFNQPATENVKSVAEPIVTEQFEQPAAEHTEPVLAEHVEQPAIEHTEPVLTEHVEQSAAEHIEPVAVEQVHAEQVGQQAAENVKPVAEPIVTEPVEQPAAEHTGPVLAEHVEQPAIEHTEPVLAEHVEQPAIEHTEPVVIKQAKQPATENIEQVLAEQFNKPVLNKNEVPQGAGHAEVSQDTEQTKQPVTGQNKIPQRAEQIGQAVAEPVNLYDSAVPGQWEPPKSNRASERTDASGPVPAEPQEAHTKGSSPQDQKGQKPEYYINPF